MGEKTKTINIGKVIYDKIKDVFSGKCFPLVAEMTTTFPFCTYQRNTALPKDTKDRYIYEWEHQVMIKVVSEKYDESIQLAEEVIDKLYNLEGNINGIEVGEININGISDDFIENAYVQNIMITIKTN